MPPESHERRDYDIDAEAETVERILRLVAALELTSRDYALVLNQTYPDAARAFRDWVYDPLQAGNYELALRGFQNFITDYYNRQPLLREYFSGLRETLLPGLAMLALATRDGVEPSA